MKPKKIISCLLLTVCCTLFSGSLTIEASGSWPAGPEITGDSAIVMDVETGTVLYEKNSHQQHYPASITKILTALLAIENSRLEENVTFSYDAVHKTEGSSIWRDVDEVMTMEQCLYALMLNSANECAYAIAEHTGGTYENFVKMMNDRAAALGCTDTHFNNPHGLTDEEHYTSCYDMALIAREAMQNELFRQITGTKRYNIPPTNKHPDETTYLTNHQKMMWEGEEYYYEYCIGGKTGYTEAAGNTLVTFAEKDQMTLICVVMKEKPKEQYEDTIALLDYCFANFKSYNIAQNLGEDEQIPGPEDGFLTCESFADIDENAEIMLPIDAEFGDAALSVVYDRTDENTAGTLQYSYADRVVGRADIKLTREGVEQFPFGQEEAAQEGTEKKVVQINPLYVVLVILGVLLLAGAGFGIYKFGDNFYLLRYKLLSWKRQKPGKIVIKSKRRKRRR